MWLQMLCNKALKKVDYVSKLQSTVSSASKSKGRITRKRNRELLLAYACSPYEGFESAMGWGRATEAAKRYDTWVMCGNEAEADINRYLSEHGDIPGPSFLLSR